MDESMLPYGEPDRLYNSDDLLRGYDRDDPMAFAKSWDFQTYATYIVDGAATPRSLDIRLKQAGHDARIAEALKEFLTRETKPKLVGIMGGHGLSRSTAGAYAAVARLARHLTQAGYLIVTGGGPGAMEAGHVGATFSHASDLAFEQALTTLATVPDLPVLSNIVGPDGEPAPGKECAFNQARLWLNAALEVKDSAPAERGESLAIPTWFYGSEPSTPFASAYAKYFQNSIREEALITQSRAGIVYAQGAGGTLREIFEDGEQNFYATTAADFTPMIFFDPDGFWEHDAEFDKHGVTRPGVNVRDLIQKVFRYGRTDSVAVLNKVRFTVNFDEIDAVLRAHAPIAQQSLAFSLASV
jgi:predicted Rossmann-fold nucleotide-binding protein